MLFRLLERRKQRQHSAEALSSDVADMKARLSNLRHEADGQRRQMEVGCHVCVDSEGCFDFHG